MTDYRELRLTGATSGYRIDTLNGKEHIIVSVVALMEGVIWASNAPAPELVPLSVLAQAPQQWNARFVVLDHPKVNGVQVTANTPAMLEARSFGQIFGSHIDGTKLVMEAWLDPEKAALVGAEAVQLIDNIKAGVMVEVSVGAFIALNGTSGTYNGVSYTGVWIGLSADHLAFLPVGTLGACSNEMGCGTPRGAAHRITTEGIKMADSVVKKPSMLARVMGAFRAANLTPDFSDQDLKTELREALSKLEPNFYGPVCVYSDRVIFEVYENGGYCLYSRNYTMNGDDVVSMGDRIEVELVQSYEPVGQTAEQTIAALKKRASELKTAAGARHSAADVADIQSIHETIVGLGATCAALTTASGKPCGCGGAPQPTITGANMEKEARVTALMANEHNPIKTKTVLDSMDDAALTALEAHCTQHAALKTAAAAPAPAIVPMTTEQFMAAAPAELKRSMATAQRVEKDTKEALLTALKGRTEGVYTAEELAAMNVEDLTRVAKLVKIDAPIDFSLTGMSRALETGDETRKDLTPPDPYAAGLEAAAKRQ